MATLYDVRDQLSHDLGDYFTGTTTASGGAVGATLVDDALKEEDDDRFVTKQATVFIKGGQATGPTSDQERAISTKVSDTITPKRAFNTTGTAGGLIPANIAYTVHRLFSAAEKDRAVAQAIKLCFPVVWKTKVHDITIVEDQFDYDIAAALFLDNEPYQVHRVSEDDSEVTIPYFAWEPRDGTDIHLYSRLEADTTLRLYGVTEPAVTDLSARDIMIVSAMASLYLLEQSIQNNPNDQMSRTETQLQMARAVYLDRVSRFMKTAPPRHILSEAYEPGNQDVSWRVR